MKNITQLMPLMLRRAQKAPKRDRLLPYVVVLAAVGMALVLVFA